ncbi:MAG: SRPBCC family protein [Actinomycetota bacterium]
MDPGTYIEVGGRPAVRFVRTYPHPVERVWAAVATSEGLGQWFPAQVALELQVGGRVTFSGDPLTEDHPGTVLACDPPCHLAFSWGDDELYFDLEPVGAGECRLTLTNVLAQRNAAARNAAGWAVCLGELDKHLAGLATGGPHSSSALPWEPLYRAYVEAGLPSGAEVPEGA